MPDRAIVFVAGASGFVGTHLVSHLTRRGYGARTFDRSRGLKGEDLSGADAVINAAGLAHVRNPEEDSLEAFMEANRNFPADLFRRSEEAGVRRFIHISSIGVLGNATGEVPFRHDSAWAPKGPYAFSKAEGEKTLKCLAEDSKLELCIVRPPLVYGSGVKGNFRLLERLVEKRLPLPFGRVDNRRDFVSIYNLMDCIERCIRHPSAAGEAFLVSDGEPISTKRLVQLIGKGLGVPVMLVPVPVPFLRMLGWLTGMQGEVEKLCGNLEIDISHTREVLEWTPPWSVEESFNKMYSQPPNT